MAHPSFRDGRRTDERRAIAGWRVLLLQWQPSSSQLEWLLWRRRRYNRRIVCGQIPRPLPLVWHGGDGMEQQGRKEERKEGWLTFAPETDFSPRQPKNERKRRGNPSKRVAAFLVAPSSSSFAAPSLSRSCSCGISKGGGTGGRFGDCSSVGSNGTCSIFM